MVRDKPLKTRVKEAREIASATELGKQLGDYKGQQRKPLEVSLKEHIETFVKNLKADDIIKLSAWLGLAYTIKPLIQNTTVVIEYIKQSAATFPEMVWANWLAYFEPIPSWLGLTGRDIVAENVEKARKAVKLDEPISWVLALVISALIIEFGPSMIEAMGSVGKFAGLLLGP